MNECFVILAVMVSAYLIGSVNFAVILFRVTGKSDPRSEKSGNPGVVNVYRIAGRTWAAFVLVLDVSKAFASAMIAIWLLDTLWLPWVAVALLLGNRFPCFHGFSGGKGVANLLGFTLAAAPYFAIASAALWVLAYRVTGQAFMASFVMTACMVAGIAMSGGGSLPVVVGAVMLFGLVVLFHKNNIRQWLGREK